MSEVLALAGKFVAAIEAGDIEAVKGCYAPDAESGIISTISIRASRIISKCLAGCRVYSPNGAMKFCAALKFPAAICSSMCCMVS